MEEVSLLIEGEIFQVRKGLLCEHSDYFRAMFSGNYVENEKNVITIDVIDAASMRLIKQYMHIGLIDLSEYSLETMHDLSVAANFLQITELSKQIEYTLEIQLSASNWIETLAIAENAPYPKLQQQATAFGLFSFKYMKPKHILNIQKLFWYLSHPYLDTRSELDVFKFGLQWILQAETGADALIIILCCLDMKRLTKIELEEIKNLVPKDYVNSLGEKIIDCLLELLHFQEEISENLITDNRDVLCKKFTETVYNEVHDLVHESKARKLKFVPVLPVWMLKDGKAEDLNFLCTFNEDKGLERWLEIAHRYTWGWSIVSWGPTRIVVVGGELGRGTGNFIKDVRVYDVIKKEWISHGVQLPARRHFGVTIVRDSLFIVGGVGGFRVVLETALIYDLKQRSYRKIASLPDAIENTAVCSHEEKVYASGHNNIYRYEDLGDTDRWVKVASTTVRMSCMVSFKEYIYCSQSFFTIIYRFRPDIDDKLECITGLSNPPVFICDIGNEMLIFTRGICDTKYGLAVEKYTGKDEKPMVLWSNTHPNKIVYEVAGICSVVMDLPPMDHQVSSYHKKYLSKFAE